MNCDQVQNLLGRFHDGELGPADRSAVATHLGGCPRCAAELAAAAELGELARALPEPEPPPDLWDRIDRRLADADFRARPVRCLPRPWTAAAAAAVLLVALAAGWGTYRALAPDREQDLSLDDLVGARPGRPMSLQEAARQVDFRVIPVSDLADGYRLKECCLCREGCCDVVRCKFLRGADPVLLVQCSPDRPVRFGRRPVLSTHVHGKPVCIGECDGRLAVTWQARDATLCLIGPRDLAELVRLMACVEKCLDQAQ
jgi:hypothetical protein